MLQQASVISLCPDLGTDVGLSVWNGFVLWILWMKMRKNTHFSWSQKVNIGIKFINEWPNWLSTSTINVQKRLELKDIYGIFFISFPNSQLCFFKVKLHSVFYSNLSQILFKAVQFIWKRTWICHHHCTFVQCKYSGCFPLLHAQI